MQAANKGPKKKKTCNKKKCLIFHGTLIHQKFYLLSEQLLPLCRRLHLCEMRRGVLAWALKKNKQTHTVTSLPAMNRRKLIAGSHWAGGAWVPLAERPEETLISRDASPPRQTLAQVSNVGSGRTCVETAKQAMCIFLCCYSAEQLCYYVNSF